MQKEIFSWSLRTCSSCSQWSTDGAIFDAAADVVVCCCKLGQHGHNRNEAPGLDWMRGSDSCSKWSKE